MRAAAFTIALMLGGLGAACAQVPGEVVLWGDEYSKPPTNAANYDPERAEIKIDAAVFFELRSPAVGYTVAEREVIILQRIIEIFGSGKIAPVYVAPVRGRPTIYVDKVRLVTVYPEDVVSYGARSAWTLAEQWAEGVRKGLLLTAPSHCFGTAPLYRVAIGGKLFFRLIDPAGYENVGQRGRAVDARLAAIVSEFDPSLVALMRVPRGVAVMFDGEVVVVATPGDAGPRGMSADALAAAWAGNLRRIMPLVKDGIAATPIQEAAAEDAPTAAE